MTGGHDGPGETPQGALEVGVSFRRLTDDDLPTMHRWLNEPGVVRWWEGNDVSWDGVVGDYGSASTDPEEHWIASVDGRDLGWIQCGAPVNWPDESVAWAGLGVDLASTAGIDYLIGDAADRGRGLGSTMIRAFVDRVVFGLHPEWNHAGADPLAANTASWRALEKAGWPALLTPSTAPAGSWSWTAADHHPLSRR